MEGSRSSIMGQGMGELAFELSCFQVARFATFTDMRDEEMVSEAERVNG